MKNENDVEIYWQEQANHVNAAIGYYEMGMVNETELGAKQNRPIYCCGRHPRTRFTPQHLL